MSVLYISEYRGIAGSRIPPTSADNISDSLFVAPEPPLAEQTVAIGAASAQSAPFSAETRFIRVHTDAACSILVGANPTATTAKKRLAADQTEYFGVRPGDRIAVIENT
jgi:hypothetical protein